MGLLPPLALKSSGAEARTLEHRKRLCHAGCIHICMNLQPKQCLLSVLYEISIPYCVREGTYKRYGFATTYMNSPA